MLYLYNIIYQSKMSTIQQLQEIVSDIVDSGLGGIPDQQQLGTTTDTTTCPCPVMHDTITPAAPSHTSTITTEQCQTDGTHHRLSGTNTPEFVGPLPANGTVMNENELQHTEVGVKQENKVVLPRENADAATETCHTDVANTIQETTREPPPPPIQQTTSNDSHTSEPHYLNDDQMLPQPHKESYQTTTPTPQIPIVPHHMQQEIPPPYQSNPHTPEIHRAPCRFHQNMPSPYHSNSNTPAISRVPCHRFTHTFEDDSYSLNSTLTSLEVGHLQVATRTPCQVASSSLESQFRLPINERGLFLQDAVFEKAAPVLQTALREVLGRGWGPGRHTTMADEMVRYRNMRAGDMDGRTQVTVITRYDTFYLIVVDMHEYLEGSIQLKVGGCCSILVEGWMEVEDGDDLVTYDFNRRFPTPDMAELKDISADLSSDGILCITVPTIALDDLCYRPGPQYNDSSYEPLVEVHDIQSQNTIASSGRPEDNRNPRHARYWHDSHHQDPSLHPLVVVDTHGHDTTASTVRLEGPEASGRDRQLTGEGTDENVFTYKSCRSDSVSSNRSFPVVC